MGQLQLVDAQGNDKTPTGPIAEVCICVPHGDMVPWSFANDLARMLQYTTRQYPGITVHLLFCGGSLIPKQREQLARAAVERSGTTHVMWIDSDMRFPNDALVRLLSHALPAVCASYTERVPPFRPVAFLDAKDFNKRVWPLQGATGLVKIAACGLGMMLVHADVFRAMDAPWFAVAYNQASGTFLGEDVFFCLKMGNVVDLMLDQDLTHAISHTGRFEFSARHAVEYGEVHGWLKHEEPELTTLEPTGPEMPAVTPTGLMTPANLDDSDEL